MVKKGIIFFVILSVTILGIRLILNYENNTFSSEEDLRLRIIANSDSAIDQENKIIVKNAIKEILGDLDALEVSEIEKRLSEKIGEQINDEITVEITKSYYPAKTYEEKFIPAGRYQTLLITIGEGKGSNFWTLLYPEYFDITFEEQNEIEYRSYIVELWNKITKG